MEIQQLKSIKNISLIITVISGLIIFSNLMGVIMHTLLGFGDTSYQESSETTFIDSLFDNYIIFCLTFVFIGVLYFIGGINLKKYKLWAKNLIVILSVCLIIISLAFVILGINTYIADKGMLFFMILSIFMGIAFSIPLFFLIRYLNKKGMKELFH